MLNFPGKLISLEGTEGAGKSTALTFVHEYLTQAGKSVIVTREPGGTLIAEELRQKLLHPANQEVLQKETELLLMFAARVQHIMLRILPALKKGQWVVSDRFLDATYAYQGGGRGMDVKLIDWLTEHFTYKVTPNLTLLLDIPADQGMARTEQRNILKDRIEQETPGFFERVRTSYLERAAHEPQRIKIIDASQNLAAVQAQIAYYLDEFIQAIQS